MVSRFEQASSDVIGAAIAVLRNSRIDLWVDDFLVVELKAVHRLEAIDEAQLLSYLKLSGSTVGLLINFNVEVLKTGIHGYVMGQREPMR